MLCVSLSTTVAIDISYAAWMRSSPDESRSVRAPSGVGDLPKQLQGMSRCEKSAKTETPTRPTMKAVVTGATRDGPTPRMLRQPSAPSNATRSKAAKPVRRLGTPSATSVTRKDARFPSLASAAATSTKPTTSRPETTSASTTTVLLPTTQMEKPEPCNRAQLGSVRNKESDSPANCSQDRSAGADA